MFGKWHLGDTWPYAPRYRGFQDVVRHLAGGIDEIGNPIGNDYFDDTYYRNGMPEKIDGYCTDVFFDECERFISELPKSRFSSTCHSTRCTVRTRSPKSTLRLS